MPTLSFIAEEQPWQTDSHTLVYFYMLLHFFLRNTSAMLLSFRAYNELNCILPKGVYVQVLILSTCELVSFGNVVFAGVSIM